jgi:hypothetical protein
MQNVKYVVLKYLYMRNRGVDLMAYVKNGFLIAEELTSNFEVLVALNKITHISSSQKGKENLTRLNFGETADTYMYVDVSESYEEIKRALDLEPDIIIKKEKSDKVTPEQLKAFQINNMLNNIEPVQFKESRMPNKYIHMTLEQWNFVKGYLSDSWPERTIIDDIESNYTKEFLEQ